jgi:F-type H+-transporting ATPase subunit epsilon
MLKLKAVSPERKVLEMECSQIMVPTKMGQITILPSHAPLFSVLNYGEVTIWNVEKIQSYLLVSGGFVSVVQNEVVLLTDFGVRSDELDEKAISAAKFRAEQEMKEKGSNQNLSKLQADLLHVNLQMEFLKRRKHGVSPRPVSE